MKRTLISIAALFATLAAFSQSKDFKMGQWVEVNNAILKELNRSYVDSLPLGRIERTGINAMLENLDPYTVYYSGGGERGPRIYDKQVLRR